jgi:hypothetical protein
VSTSESHAHLTVQGGGPTLEVEVLDSNFEHVGSGVGNLNLAVAPGLYEVRFREGSAHESRLVKVEPGTTTVDPPQLETSSPAPVDQTVTTHEYHQQPVVDASGAIASDCAAPGPETGGLVVMVRNVRGQDDLSFPSDLTRQFAVLDANLKPMSDGPTWHEDRQAKWALWSRAVVPGGYALRIKNGESPGESLYQSIWVDPGWQTMVFIPNTPDGPAAELATVHIVPIGQWTPWDEGSTVAVALESVLDGLRNGRSVVPADLNELFHAKFVNPFLGIAAAHALLLNPQPSLRQLKSVIGNLERLLPQSPDVVALGHRARAAGVKLKPRGGVVWPPIMYAGYRALLRADASSPGVISDGSRAESAAPLVRISGLWTTWVAEEATSRTRAIARDIGETIGLVDEPDPAKDRVRTYVRGAARVRGVSESDILDQKSLKQLALATGLPSASVRGAVSSLKDDLA